MSIPRTWWRISLYSSVSISSRYQEKKLNPYFIHRINILKFGKLFRSKQKCKLKNLCKFLRVINSQVVLPS